MPRGKHKNQPRAAKHVTTFRRLVREAGYELPADFDWQKHLIEDVIEDMK